MIVDTSDKRVDGHEGKKKRLHQPRGARATREEEGTACNTPCIGVCGVDGVGVDGLDIDVNVDVVGVDVIGNRSPVNVVEGTVVSVSAAGFAPSLSKRIQEMNARCRTRLNITYHICYMLHDA